MLSTALLSWEKTEDTVDVVTSQSKADTGSKHSWELHGGCGNAENSQALEGDRNWQMLDTLP